VIFKKYPNREKKLFKSNYHKYFSGITTVLNDLKTKSQFHEDYLLNKWKTIISHVNDGEISRLLTDSDNSDFNVEEEKKYEVQIEDIKATSFRFKKDVYETMLKVEKNESGGISYIYNNPSNYHPELKEIITRKKKNASDVSDPVIEK
jgi:hypothetical protein